MRMRLPPCPYCVNYKNSSSDAGAAMRQVGLDVAGVRVHKQSDLENTTKHNITQQKLYGVII